MVAHNARQRHRSALMPVEWRTGRARTKLFDFFQITDYALYVMNDSPEEEEDDDILIGEGDDWPETTAMASMLP